MVRLAEHLGGDSQVNGSDSGIDMRGDLLVVIIRSVAVIVVVRSGGTMTCRTLGGDSQFSYSDSFIDIRGRYNL